MIKLITPPDMLVTVALLAIYCAYASWTAFIDKSWIYAVVALISLSACVGTAFLKSWSRYPVYVLTVGFVTVWCYSVYAAAQVGFFGFYFPSRRGDATFARSELSTRGVVGHLQHSRLPPLPADAASPLNRLGAGDRRRECAAYQPFFIA